MSGFSNPIIGGGGSLVYPSIHSPNFVPGVSGWSINKDGSAQFNQITLIVQASQTAILIYQGSAGLGTLIGSWSGSATSTTDQYGNVVPPGLFAQGGTLTGLTIDVSTLTNAIVSSPAITGGTWTNPSLNGGTITEAVITLDSTGGQVFGYAQVTTTVTNPASPWSRPAGVTVAKVECIGSGAGGGGGNTSTGGEAGGGGEYASEPALSLTLASYQVIVPLGGNGGSTGTAGTSGADAIFGNNLVIGNGGSAGSGGVAGHGGTGSTNFDHSDGGNGGTGNLGVAGAGGGGSGGANQAGGQGGNGGASPGAGGAAGSGGGASGGAGGASAANGNNGNTPGAGGGGAGKGTTNQTVTETFSPATTWSYRTDGGLSNTNGVMHHGAYSGEPGYQYSYIQWATGSQGHGLNSVLNGSLGTVKSVTLRLHCEHCWNNSGATWGLHSSTSLGGGVGTYSTILGSFSALGEDQNPGQGTKTYTLGSTQWAPFAAGGVTYLVLGPDAADEFALGWYCYFDGKSGATPPLLTVTYQASTAGSFNAGDGANGQVKITYQTSTALAFALSPAAGTDPNGNAFGSGYTGQVQNFHPGSNPTTVETWQSLTLPGGLTGLMRVKKIAESGYIMVDCQVSWTATTASTFNLPALPYAVNTNQSRVYTMKGNSTETAAGQSARLFIGAGGTSVQILVPASTGGGTGTVSVIIPTD